MNKKKLSILVAIFFLVQGILFSRELSSETCALNHQPKVTLDASNIPFKQIYDALCQGLFIYKLDAMQRYPKGAIIREYGKALFDLSGVRFDLERIDAVKKGWTRYYPFSIGERHFIIRIFLTEEAAYQSKEPVLFEGTIRDPAVTFQILPGINAILADCKVKPQNIYPVSQVATSP